MKIKRIKNIILVLFLFCISLNITSTEIASGAGIPVIDVVSIARQITSYMTQLSQYAEAIQTTNLNISQYTQMIEDYRQTLREYQHYLNQIQSIRHMISNHDWLLLMQTIDNYYGQSKRSVVATMDVASPTYENDVETVLSNYGYVPRDPVDVKNDAQTLNMWTNQYETEVDQDYEAYDLYKDRMRQVSKNASRSRERQQDEIPVLTSTLSSLGDDSDLQTLQLIAAENITIIKQQEQQIDMLNQSIAYMQNEEALQAAKRAKTRNDEIERLQNRTNVQTPGTNRWGSF